uniref:CB1 cannabinoid receptor-interacting protein 1 isoform X1 n=1 Tax=Myxine glutinosa TaxID=7769 RepID=UPI00358DF8A7
MEEVPSFVKIAISLKMMPSEAPVFFKVDGQRFHQTRTIKLLTGAKYKVEVVLKPSSLKATTIVIGECDISLEEASRDASEVKYSGSWDTEDLMATKSGERQPTAVCLKLADIGAFEAVWQCKFYNYQKRDHCKWGNSFNAIVYECRPNDTRTLLWINKENFQ